MAALVHIAKGEFLQAGRHLDREAESLRWAGNFREIPGVLELSAAAYEQSGMLSLAADRFGRLRESTADVVTTNERGGPFNKRVH